jgi:NAD-dependent dihydropyrimidine dehydrogenase PreA subunit
MTDLYKQLKHVLPGTADVDSDVETELLKTIFTEKEAQIALHMQPTFESIDDIASKTGIHRDELEEALEGMIDKGIVYPLQEKGKKSYKLMPPAWMMDVILMGKEETPDMQKVAKLQPEYFVQGWGEKQHNRPVSFARVIPLEDALPKDEEIFPWERISTVIESADFWAIADCPCRHGSEIREDGCGRIKEDVCPFFGDLARFLVDRGIAKQITKQEAYQIQEKCRDEGLVFTTNNAQEYIWTCNCCGCCCVMLWGINRISHPNAIVKANFIAEVDIDECTACGTCEDQCCVQSIQVKDDYAKVDESTCLGCGVCVVSCPSNAIRLKRRKEIVVPPVTLVELSNIVGSTGTALVSEERKND